MTGVMIVVGVWLIGFVGFLIGTKLHKDMVQKRFTEYERLVQKNMEECLGEDRFRWRKIKEHIEALERRIFG